MRAWRAGRTVRLEVDGSGEVVERRGILARVQVHQPEIVRDDPLERVEVERTLEARDRRDVYLSVRVFRVVIFVSFFDVQFLDAKLDDFVRRRRRRRLNVVVVVVVVR